MSCAKRLTSFRRKKYACSMKNCLVNATVIKFSNEEILRCCFSEDSEKGVQRILLLVQSICGVLIAVIIADAFFMRAGAQKKKTYVQINRLARAASNTSPQSSMQKLPNLEV